MNPLSYISSVASLPSGVLGRALSAAALLLCATAAQAQVAIQSIRAAMQGGAEVVRIELSAPLSQLPTGFVVQSPARVALDFPGVVNAVGANVVEIGTGNLRSANVVQAGERTRVVLNLSRAVNYEARLEGNAVVVALQPAPVAAAFAVTQPLATTPPVSGAAAVAAPALRDIDFRRGSDGSGRLIVELGSQQTAVDVRQQGRQLVVELLHTALPEGLRRRLDVADFGTPVRMVTATQVGDRVRLQIESTGAWEHSAYQSDQQFVLEVREVKVDPNKLTQGPGFTGEKLSLNFQNIEVRALLQVIADFTNFNIITADTVTGNVTLRLKDVPWDQALDIVLQAKGLGMRRTGNVIWVAPEQELLARERTELEARQQIRGLEQPRTQSFRLNFAKAEDVAERLTTAVGTGENQNRMLSRQGSVFAEPRTNQLFVTDIASKLEEVGALIQQIDIPIRQVLIEARIVEAEDNFGRALGARFGGRIQSTGVGSINGNEVRGSLGFGSIGATAAGSSALTNIPVPTQNSGVFAISLFNPSQTRLINLEIQANESDRRLRTISSPRVVTADQRQAQIEDGRKFPFLRRDADGNVTTEFIDASLKLIVTPQITPDGDVIMELEVNNDTPIVFNGETAIQTKSVQTQVLVENGGTVVIGGILVQEDLNNADKVPGLGDLPVLGGLFRSRSTSTRQSEMLVFITPRVLSPSPALAAGR